MITNEQPSSYDEDFQATVAKFTEMALEQHGIDRSTQVFSQHIIGQVAATAVELTLQYQGLPPEVVHEGEN